MALNWESTTRVQKKIRIGKQRNSQEETETGDITVGVNYRSKIAGTELGKCDKSVEQERQLKAE